MIKHYNPNDRPYCRVHHDLRMTYCEDCIDKMLNTERLEFAGWIDRFKKNYLFEGADKYIINNAYRKAEEKAKQLRNNIS